VRVFDHVVEGLWPIVVDTSDLVFDPVNARSHSERNLSSIKASLKTFKQRTPIVVQKTQSGQHIVRKGNGTLMCARQMVEAGDERWKSLACVVVEEDNTTATGYAIADNRTAELAEWNDNLGALLKEISKDEPDLFAATGFNNVDLMDLLGEIPDDMGAQILMPQDDKMLGRVVVVCPVKHVGKVEECVQRALDKINLEAKVQGYFGQR
jgi:hypothetical protein